MRKVGLWGFQQIESSLTDLEASCGLTNSPIPGAEGRPEHFPLVPESPRRMMTRSQDSTVSPGSEQVLASLGCHCHSGLEIGGRLCSNLISKPVVSRFTDGEAKFVIESKYRNTIVSEEFSYVGS